MKAVMWSIRKPHTDNIKEGIKWDEIRKRIPKNLTPLVKNYIYETKANGGCGKVIGEFIVQKKTYIYAYEHNGSKHLCNTAFIMPALSDDELYNYLYDGKENDGWALRISELKIYDKPKELGEFRYHCKYEYDDDFKHCHGCDYYYFSDNPSSGREEYCCCDGLKRLTKSPQSWQYIEELGE